MVYISVIALFEETFGLLLYIVQANILGDCEDFQFKRSPSIRSDAKII